MAEWWKPGANRTTRPSKELCQVVVGRDHWHARSECGAIMSMTDGPNGVNPSQHGGSWSTVETTAFPTGTLMAATWNPEILRRAATTIAQEAVATGHNLVLGPCINLCRSPVWGETWESFGEDPCLAGRLAVEYVRGLHDAGVGSSVKHFCCYNLEDERKSVVVIVDEGTLRELYLPAFERVVRETGDSGLLTVMTSYNSVNAIKVPQNQHLLKEILRTEWGFKGVVLSDWGGCADVAGAISVGMSLKMPGPPRAQELEKLRGLPQEVLARAAGEVTACAKALRSVARRERKAPPSVSTPENKRCSQSVAEEGVVLLKNDGSCLPLVLASLTSLLVAGPNASSAFCFSGVGSAGVPVVDPSTPLKLLQTRVGTSVRFIDACSDPSLLEHDDLHCDVALVFVGSPHGNPPDVGSWKRSASSTALEGENRDRTSLSLPQGQDDLVLLASSRAARTVVVVNSGGPVAMPWLQSTQTVLWCGYPGCRGAQALVSILFGDVCPSGKLPLSFPVRLEDTPAVPGGSVRIGRQTRKDVPYTEGLLMGYRRHDALDVAPLFCFGHGLSYTTFVFHDVKLDWQGAPQVKTETFMSGSSIRVECQVTNTGPLTGAEVVQLYVGPALPVFGHCIKQLKGFRKTPPLAPGQTCTATFDLVFRDFAHWQSSTKQWSIAPSEQVITLAASSRDPRLTTVLTLSKSE